MKSPHPGETIYAGAARALIPLIRLGAPFSAKLRRGLEGRRGLAARLDDAAVGLKGCVWFHATSVGEYEQALPILRALGEAGVGPLAVTHFSPSGRDYAREHPAGDHHDYLPFDHPDAMRALVAAWQPRALVFVKYDCWPSLVRAADEADVPVILLSGSLPPGSWRHRGPLRSFFRAVFDRFAHLGVGSEADRRRFTENLGVSVPVTVTGDTRAEQVLTRYEASADSPLAAQLLGWGEQRLILGSTWPEDEALWWPVLPDLLSRFPGLRVVLVPHEPTSRRLRDIETVCADRGIPALRLSDYENDPTALAGARCLLVDRIGVLAGLYRAGTVAYVGGSFTTGVHSTLEPAAASLPVCFGPRHDNAEEAVAMVQGGFGFVVKRPEEAAARLLALLEDPEARLTAGTGARAVVDAQRGAAERSAALVLDQIRPE